MNKFDKLYNLILESVINQNKASRAQMLSKNSTLSEGMKGSITYYLNTLDNKTADFLCKYFANGQLNSLKDKKLDQIINIIKLNPSIDTQRYKGSLDQFIQQYRESLNKYQQKQNAKYSDYLDSIYQFTKDKEYPNGVVIYDVEDSKDGMNAVREIVDAQWGYDANPWCLVARDEEYGYHDTETYYGDDEYVEEDQALMRNAWEHWRDYSAYPKQIAFQNGKLLAFSANDTDETAWWDRNDNKTHQLKLLDGSFLNTEK